MENINSTNSNAETAENHLDKGDTFSDQGDYESAISAYDKALDLNPNLAVAYFKRGNAKEDIGQHFEAISTMMRLYAWIPTTQKHTTIEGV